MVPRERLLDSRNTALVRICRRRSPYAHPKTASFRGLAGNSRQPVRTWRFGSLSLPAELHQMPRRRRLRIAMSGDELARPRTGTAAGVRYVALPPTAADADP